MAHRLHDAHCAIAQALSVLGDSWTLLVVREAFFGTRRFADFQSNLGISRNILAERLRHLVEQDVLERVDVGKVGERFEYQLTARGRDLATVMTALRQWSDRWIFGQNQEPLQVIDKMTNEPILPLRIRRADGSEIPSSELEFRLGPGATSQMKDRERRRRNNE